MCMLKTRTPTDYIFQTGPIKPNVCVISYVKFLAVPFTPIEMNCSLWELPEAWVDICMIAPTSVYHTVVNGGCISVMNSLRKCMLHSALISQHLAQCLAGSKCYILED